jgi:hypothetical protein
MTLPSTTDDEEHLAEAGGATATTRRGIYLLWNAAPRFAISHGSFQSF